MKLSPRVKNDAGVQALQRRYSGALAKLKSANAKAKDSMSALEVAGYVGGGAALAGVHRAVQPGMSDSTRTMIGIVAAAAGGFQDEPWMVATAMGYAAPAIERLAFQAARRRSAPVAQPVAQQAPPQQLYSEVELEPARDGNVQSVRAVAQ